MLIKFKSEQSGDFVMMGDVALPLLRMMGNSGKPEGAVSGQELRDSLTRLETALQRIPKREENDEEVEEEEQASVSLTTRASPLLAMLRKAAGEDGYVMWQQE